MTTLDDARAAYPRLGFAIYAYTPGGPVKIEVLDGEDIFEFVGATEAEAIKAAFPELDAPPAPPTPAPSIFD